MWLSRTSATFAEAPWPARLGWGLLGCSLGRSWAMVSAHHSSSRSFCSGRMLFTYLHANVSSPGMHACRQQPKSTRMPHACTACGTLSVEAAMTVTVSQQSLIADIPPNSPIDPVISLMKGSLTAE